MLSHCASLWFLQDLFLRAWPSSTWQFVLPWWSSAHPGDKRNLIRTLVPISLYAKLKASMRMTPEQLSAFLAHRRPAITTAVHTCHQWLQDHPPPSLPSLRSGINHFTTPNSIKEGPYQDRPPLCPFRLSPLLTCSGSTIAFLKILKIQGPNPKI